MCGAALVDTPTTGDDYQGQPELDVKALEKQLATALAPRYELLKLLGAGGMGAVFLAREAALKRLVAVKVLAPFLAADPPARARFQREARAAAALSHPNVVRVYAVGETRSKLPYIVMQYVEGMALTDWLRHKGRVPEREARRIIGEVAAALAAAHARDLVHRDVKPANVLIEAETGRAFVADFGVSAALSPAGRQETKLTATGMIIGTPPYMSPEQAAGDAVTPKSDVYSLGVLAYELLTGALPFTANTTAGWAAAHLRDMPEPVTQRRTELTPQLARLVERCLAKPPRDRPAAAEVARALLPSLETEIRWPPPGLGSLFGRGPAFTRELLITAGAGLLVLLALAFTPDVLEVHERWLSRFALEPAARGALARARPTPDSSQVSFFVWQTALILGSAVFLLGVFYLAAVAYWLRRALKYRALGWSWLTLLDVAADDDGRSGLLLAGGGEFGFLDESERGRILRARRLRVTWLLAAAIWLFTILGIWIGSAVLGLLSPESAVPLGGPLRLAVALIPLLGFLVAADLAVRTERRLMGPVSSKRYVAVTPVEVEEWYRTVPGALAGQPDPRIYHRSRTFHLTAVAAAVVVAAVIAVGLGEVVLASVAAARFVQSVAPRAAELNASVRRLAAANPYAEARRLLTPYLPVQTPVAELTARGVIRQLFNLDTLLRLPPAPWVDQGLLGPPPAGPCSPPGHPPRVRGCAAAGDRGPARRGRRPSEGRGVPRPRASVGRGFPGSAAGRSHRPARRRGACSPGVHQPADAGGALEHAGGDRGASARRHQRRGDAPGGNGRRRAASVRHPGSLPVRLQPDALGGLVTARVIGGSPGKVRRSPRAARCPRRPGGPAAGGPGVRHGGFGGGGAGHAALRVDRH